MPFGLDSFLWWLDSTLVRLAVFCAPFFLSSFVFSCSATPHVGALQGYSEAPHVEKTRRGLLLLVARRGPLAAAVAWRGKPLLNHSALVSNFRRRLQTCIQKRPLFHRACSGPAWWQKLVGSCKLRLQDLFRKAQSLGASACLNAILSPLATKASLLRCIQRLDWLKPFKA